MDFYDKHVWLAKLKMTACDPYLGVRKFPLLPNKKIFYISFFFVTMRDILIIFIFTKKWNKALLEYVRSSRRLETERL